MVQGKYRTAHKASLCAKSPASLHDPFLFVIVFTRTKRLALGGILTLPFRVEASNGVLRYGLQGVVSLFWHFDYLVRSSLTNYQQDIHQLVLVRP